MEWSFELLPPPERRLLARLAVFPQNFDLPAAAAVAGDEGEHELDVLDRLVRLIDKSLVVPQGAAATARYRLLETVRQYALEVLAATGDEAEARRRHRQHFVRWIEVEFHPGDNLRSDWLRALDAERENCYAALAGAVAEGDWESVAVLVAGSYGLWFWWYSVPETLDPVDSRDLHCANPSILVEAHLGVFWAGFVTGRLDWEAALEIFRRALTIADEEGRGWEQGWLRVLFGFAARSQGDIAAARAWLEAARERFTETTDDVGPHYELGRID